VHGAIHNARREPGYRTARAHAEVAVEDARIGVGDRAPGQNREAAGSSETHWRNRRASGRLRSDKHDYGGDDYEGRAEPGVASKITGAADIRHLSGLSPMALCRTLAVVT
jgi:hypothetical protein